MTTWDLHMPSTNPPYIPRIPARMEYLRHFALDIAYIAPQQQMELLKAYKRHIYGTLQTSLSMTPEPAHMRVTHPWPNTNWVTVWRNLQETPVLGETKVIWYRVIHEIVPTRERLHRINMTPMDTCHHCNKTETLCHHLTKCGEEGTLMWKWTQKCLASILRTDRRRIPEDWLLYPTLSLWPPKRHRAVLWMLTNFVLHRLQQR